MEAELHRAMSELGSAITPVVPASDKTSPQKPYYLSYSVADAENVSITAQYGAITNSNESRRRNARRLGRSMWS